MWLRNVFSHLRPGPSRLNGSSKDELDAAKRQADETTERVNRISERIRADASQASQRMGR